MYSKRTLALGLLVLCLISQLAVAQHYTITDLGPLAPTGINTVGQVVGNYNGHAFIWTKTGGMRDLGTLAGGTFSSTEAINDLGVVTGVADGPGVLTQPGGTTWSCNDLVQPFVWTRPTGMRGLGALQVFLSASEPCLQYTYASDINVRGQVVGNNRDAGTYKYGFLWTFSGESLFADDYQTAANGINDAGQVVGQTGVFRLGTVSHAALWDHEVKTDLGTLRGPDPDWNYCSGANGVNDVGQVVGWSATSAFQCEDVMFSSLDAVHAFLWKAGAGMQDLGTLPGDTSSVARKINFFGHVIGSSGKSVTWQDGDPGGSIEVVGRPFIWSERSGMRDLNTLIRGNSKWVLSSANDINVWGQIVGQGTLNGKQHGFLLTPRAFFKF